MVFSNEKTGLYEKTNSHLKHVKPQLSIPDHSIVVAKISYFG